MGFNYGTLRELIMNSDYEIGRLDCSKLKTEEIIKYADMELKLKQNFDIYIKEIFGGLNCSDLKDAETMEAFFDNYIGGLKSTIDEVINNRLQSKSNERISGIKLILQDKWVDALTKNINEHILYNVVHEILERYGIEQTIKFLDMYKEDKGEESKKCKMIVGKLEFDYSSFNVEVALKLEALMDIIKTKICEMNNDENEEFEEFCKKYPAATKKDFYRVNSKNINENNAEKSSLIDAMFREAKQYFQNEELFDRWKNYASASLLLNKLIN